MSVAPRIETLGQLRAAVSRGEIRRRSVKDEVRENLSDRLRRKQTLFPGIIGYDETVVPQVVRSTVGSWMMTGTPSRERWTSTSSPSAP